MKRIIGVFLVFVFVFALCSCSDDGSVSINKDDTEAYYNGNTYIYDENLTTYCNFDTESEECVTIGNVSDSDGIVPINPVYGNDLENPDYLFCSRDFSSRIYIRSDLVVDINGSFALKNNKAIQFTFDEITTGETVRYTTYDRADYKFLFSFEAAVDPYSAIYQTFDVLEKDGRYYILNIQWHQECEYREITKEFYEELSQALQKKTGDGSASSVG